MATRTYDTRTRLHRAYLVLMKLKREFVNMMEAEPVVVPAFVRRLLNAYRYKGRHHFDPTKKQVTRILDENGQDTGEREVLSLPAPAAPSLRKRVRQVREQRRVRRDSDRVWHLPTGEYEVVEKPGWIMRERTLQRDAEVYR